MEPIVSLPSREWDFPNLKVTLAVIVATAAVE